MKKLAIIDDLLSAFHKQNILYCHWKSNEHLDASMVADTDLDVLFDQTQKKELELILSKVGFKLFKAPKQKQYKDIEDYIGLDFQSGKIVHLHTHYRLTLGEVNLKSYQLNFEDKILSSRVYDEEFGIYRTAPAFELVLLFYRQALKIRASDKINIHLKDKIDFTSNILKEYEWLKKRCNESDIEAVLKSIVPGDYQRIYQFITGAFNRIELAKLAELLKEKYKSQRLYSPLYAATLRAYREMHIKGFRRYSRLVNTPMVHQRINPRGGLTIAVIGADGSGKSTVIANLQSTFKKKLDVYSIYFGSGAGKVSWPRKFLSALKKAKPAKKKKQSAKTEQSVSGKKKGYITNVYKCIQSLIVANEKRKNLKRMLLAKKKGMLVICDRFPQNQILGYNDGPMLQSFAVSSSPLFRMMAKKEAGIYKQFEETTPDIIFKLIAEAEVVEARKPGETPLEILKAKIEGVKQLNFPDSCEVITVNAEEPLEKVLFTIKKKIWEAYH